MRRQAVILGFTEDMTAETADEIVTRLETMFPDVRFALLAKAAGHIAFEYDDGEPEPWRPPQRYPDLLESR